ncbi:MAG: hypothetical protein ACLFTT_17805 [Candidatus Hydrogenedentota bacterium]
MAKRLTADDILALIATLGPQERLRLLRLITQQSPAEDAAAYTAAPTRDEEFASDEDPLVWDSEGWEEFE